MKGGSEEKRGEESKGESPCNPYRGEREQWGGVRQEGDIRKFGMSTNIKCLTTCMCTRARYV